VLGRADALAMLRESDELYVAKGKKVVHLDLKSADLDSVVSLVLGPTGNLRAPTLRKGRTLIVGFDESTYRSILTSS
jgi:hypothetical protein